MKRLLFFAALAALATTDMQAQTAQNWQWGKRGGGGFNTVATGDRAEQADDMAVDPNGNVYVLSNYYFQYNDVTVGNMPLSSTGQGDIVVSSFSCNGTYRWSKIIGGPGADQAVALRTDTLGGVYITGQIYNINSGQGNTNIGNDTSLGWSYKTMCLIKYDTAGNYKWIRRPQPDTVSQYGITRGRIMDLDVDAGGTSYWLCRMTPGMYAGSYSVPSESVHLLRYDRNGAFIGGTPMSLRYAPDSGFVSRWFLKRSPASGKYVISGAPTFDVYAAPPVFGSTPVNRTAFVGSFNTNGMLDWVKQSTMTPPQGASFFNRPTVDAQGNIYLTGGAATGDVFSGVTFNNYASAAGGYTPAVIKLDASGSVLWSKVANATSGVTGNAGALTSNGEYVIGGNWAGQLRWPGQADSLLMPPGPAPNVFIARLNAQTGAFIKTDTLSSGTAYSEFVTEMAADKRGNVYVGGLFTGDLKVAGQTLTAATGGYSDLFIAKYGTANCSCQPAAAAFTATVTNATRTVSAVYGGTLPVDSLVWNWGDGVTTTVKTNLTAPVTRTYTTGGAKNICVQAYSNCGGSTVCKSVSLPLGINDLNTSSVQLYPNPASGTVTVEGVVPGTELLLYSLSGQLMQHRELQSGKESVDIAYLVPGTYLVLLRGSDGTTQRLTLVVQ